MSTSFTDWDSGLYLQHHGIKGMKWGVRKYQNEDGSLTELGKARYGKNPTIKTSARKMQRDFNKLDKGFDSLSFNQAWEAQSSVNSLHYAAERARTLQKKGLSNEEIKNDEMVNYWMNKMTKSIDTIKLNDKQKKAVEDLQLKILKQAKRQGYTIDSKPVERLVTKGQKIIIKKKGDGHANVQTYNGRKMHF